MSISYSALSQPYVLAAFIYAGITVGAIYSVFRLIRRAARFRFVTVLCDLLFTAAASAVTIFVLYKAAHIVLRAYYLIGLAIGFLLYTVAMLPLIKYVNKRINCKFAAEKVDKRGKIECNNK